METTYDIYPLDLTELPSEDATSDEKKCPGLQRFCPHYTSQVCGVKYSECVLLNSLKTSEMILRMERENLIKDPTPKNLSLMAEINVALGEKNPDMTVDPKTIRRNQRKGRFVAAVLFVLIFVAAIIIYIG